MSFELKKFLSRRRKTINKLLEEHSVTTIEQFQLLMQQEDLVPTEEEKKQVLEILEKTSEPIVFTVESETAASEEINLVDNIQSKRRISKKQKEFDDKREEEQNND